MNILLILVVLPYCFALFAIFHFRNKILCHIRGHKKYNPDTLNGQHIITITDRLNQPLLTVDVCTRCGSTYASREHDIS